MSILMNNRDLQKILFTGLGPGNWGYGFKRVAVEIPESIRKGNPFTFTSVGFKNETNDYFIGLRMHVDQNSPIKFRKCMENTSVTDAWVSMLYEFFRENNINYNTHDASYRVI